MNHVCRILPRLRRFRAGRITAGLALLASVMGLPRAGLAQVQAQQAWAVAVGGAEATPAAMTIDPSGNIIVAGYDAGDYLTAKFDPGGNLLWSARQSGRVGDAPFAVPAPGITSIAVDGAGNIYVTGGLGGTRSYTTTFCFLLACVTYRDYASDQVTIKYSSNGHRQWIRSYSEKGDTSFAGRAIAVDPGGNVYVTGSATIDYTPVAGSATIKYSPSGSELWVKTNISCQTLLLDSSTNLCLACGNEGTRKLDRNGNELWTVPVHGPVLKRDASDNLYVSGGGYSGPTTKLDSGGGAIWTARFGGQMVLDPAGSLFLASSMRNNSSWDYATVKLDQQQGSLVWQAINNSFDGGEENPTALALDSSGNVYVTGRVNGMLGTLRYDLDGNRVWQTQYPAGSSPLLGLDAAGSVYVAGSSNGFLLIKYAQTVTPGAPLISPPPLHPLVRLGDNVTLSVSVTGAAPLSYQWRTPSSQIPDGTNAMLLLTNVQANQAGMYSVEVTNALGSAASREIYVSVLSPLPSQTVAPGATAVFRALLTGGGPATFQWRFNGTDLAGENRPMLALTNVGPGHVGNYTVVVSNYYGNALTSTVAQLTLGPRVTQTWAATVPAGNVGDTAQAIGVDGADNVFVCGYAACGHKVVKYNPAGSQEWEMCSANAGALAGLAVDPSGGVAIAGGALLTRYAATGALLWTTPFDDGLGSSLSAASGMTVDGAGNFYVTGSTATTNGPGLLTAKYLPAGQQAWASFYLGTVNDFAKAVVVDSVGNVYVCGAVRGSSHDFILLKYDALGRELWARTYDGPSSLNDVAAHVAVDGSGFVYVTGWSPGEDNVTDFATIKYDAAGALLWVARYNGPGSGEDNPHGLAVDAHGNVHVTGSSVGADKQYDIATLKYAPDGTPLWTRCYTGPANGNDYSRALALDPAGNVYVEGHSDSGLGSNPPTEVVTLSYDSAGNQRWVARCETGGRSGPYYRNGSMVVDGNATVYVADTTFTAGTPAFLTLKYVQRTPVPARLGIPAFSPGGQLRGGLTGGPGLRYCIQVSSDLLNWNSVTSVVTSVTGEAEFSDSLMPGINQRFYRAVEP